MNELDVFTNDTMNSTNSTNSSGTATMPSFPFYIMVTSTVFYVLIFLLGVCGNVLVIAVVCSNRNMKTSVNVYMTNLCVADILVLTLCMPTALTDIYTEDVWLFGEIMCKMVPFLENTVANASVLTILSISVERYRVVCNPLKGIGDDIKKVTRIVVVIWIISAMSSIPSWYIAIYKDSRHLDGTPVKVCRNPMYQDWHKVYVTLLTVTYFAIPFLVLAVLYGRVYYVLQMSNRIRSGLHIAQSYNDRQRLKFQVINIMTCVVVLFFICHLPFRVVSLWMTFERKEVIFGLGLEGYLNILYSSRIMFYLNHAFNPIIYNFVSTKFRTALGYMINKHRSLSSPGFSNRFYLTGNRSFDPNRHSRSVLVDNENGSGSRRTRLVERSSSSSSAGREKRSEYYPMFALIVDRNSDESTQNKVQLRFQLQTKMASPL